jgi:bifunctional UDP-N-acetylglucosamine pyrophosphorylase/glucosamine-1-phosphate N-acetyltransferase
MNKLPLHCIVLAAGQGTRMKSAKPKVLHGIGGKPMVGHVLDAAEALGAAAVHVVHGHGGDQLRAWFDRHYGSERKVYWAEQAQQLGTAHAVSQALPAIPDQAQVLILYGDVPLISVATLGALVAAGDDTLALVTVELAEPKGYGRIVRNAEGAVTGVVEENDASDAEKRIREVNTGLMSMPATRLKQWLAQVGNDNAKGEYYLTDIVAMAMASGLKVATVSAASAEEVEGANDRVQLARLERFHQRQQADALLRQGLSLADPARFDLRGTLDHGRDVSIDVGCVLEGRVSLADGVSIGPYCILRDVSIGAGTVIEAHSVLEQTVIGAAAHVGPFARLRPGTELGDETKVGNFVETKQAQVGKGSKINHLSYVGDARIGTDVNIGAGTITCNYDGANKHLTQIADGVFVGSNSSLVAPVSLGAGATIGAGSVIASDVPAGGLTLCRAREQKSYARWQRPQKNKKD